MREEYRSLCPINLAVEVFGDRWTLLILRDLIFAGKRHFREILQSKEQISSNILANRLAMLVEQGIVTKTEDPSHRQKALYSLTEKGIAILPILIQMGVWSRKYRPESRKGSTTAAMLDKGGPALWEEIEAELRRTHLGMPRRR